MEKIVGFVAYASRPKEAVNCLQEGIRIANSTGGCFFTGWEENDIAGRPLTAPIFEGLRETNLLVADITSLNFNVTFEIGYAIGVGRRVYLVRNKDFTIDSDRINKIGIFDTLGYESYDSPKSLARLISSIKDLNPINTITPLNGTTPAYILETPGQGHVMTHIKSRVKKARLFFRSFTPTEDLRLSASDAIHHVAASYGVIVPLITPGMADFEVHNIRAAFVCGLSLGFEKATLILQSQEAPNAPLDVRDFVKRYARPEDITEHIHQFSLSVYEAMQAGTTAALPLQNALGSLSVGDPMAENEFQTLGSYYLQTDEFNRATRGEVNLIVGRKGTGKTALFAQLRDHKRSDRSNVVVDLRPEGYQLLKLKEEVLDFLTAGAKHHLVTAFWEFLLYSEIAYKVLDKDADLHLRDHDLYAPYSALKKAYHGPAVSEGDFSERLLRLSDSITSDFRARYGNVDSKRLTADEVTAFLHSRDIRSVKEQLLSYLKHKNEVWLLFDNLDKGWSTHGVTSGDVTILRCLIDAARKVQRDLVKGRIDFHALVFVRNDVYQLLMDESADFGKESRATLDWSDPDLLRSMLCKRLRQAPQLADMPFDAIWQTLCVSHYQGEETSQLMIDRSLMRPRYLLKLFNACRGFAVNLQHDKINEHDIERGLYAFSNDLLVDADHELTDIEPSAKRLIYQFLGERSTFTPDDLTVLFEMHGIVTDRVQPVIDFLLYYGFLGIRYQSDDVQYIYDVGYNMEILKTRVTKNRQAIIYALHPSFWPALKVS